MYEYESPVKIIQGQLKTQMENDILKAVQDIGVVVNKRELLRALQYDRNQYEEGYSDGYRAGYAAATCCTTSEED